jgi:DNA-binding MarR family transcriptional regulator
VVTERMKELQQAYRHWKVGTVAEDWFSLYQPLISYILPKVSGNALRVYLYFVIRADVSTGEIRQYSVKDIASHLERSERAVNGWIKELQDCGLIERLQTTPNSQAYTYLLPKNRRSIYDDDWSQDESTDSAISRR